MTLEQLLENHNLPLLKELVEDLKSTVDNEQKDFAIRDRCVKVLDEIRHVVTAAYNPKDYPL